MAASTSKSAQITNNESVPSVVSKTNEDGGRVRVRYFSQTTLAQDAGSTIRLCKLYKGERLLRGRISAPIMGAANATLSLGITGTTAKYMALTAIDAALAADFAHTQALGMGEELAANSELIATTAVGATLADKALIGYILYVKD